MKPYLSAGVVVVRKAREQRLYLLLRAYNYWDFPKGKLEPEETPLAAAIREVEEESGIRDLCFDWGEAWIETRPYSRPLKIARYYLARTDTGHIALGVNPELGRPEHHEYRWVTIGQAQRLLTPRVLRVLEWAEGILNVG
ncbi:NUDIX domain-containing protein [Thiohalobacter thiocyanaticus]|uniref:NUDIX domain-containing protein n=1 Tax=Thiohalobacter thiocyanaticus TaxID=585455 RepID=A0A426QGU9_9GAMM|nr:NUDIX domain-containing protein [Thiohalobacter thiocyanaticus]RRQ20985.1 NUDIX domain-containing protein [Thiohalobacter thiocyanaticus]